MSILSFDPRVLAERLATEDVSTAKIYEILNKASNDELEQKIYCFADLHNGALLICEDDVAYYIENVLDILEKETELLWTDDTTFFDFNRTFDSIAKNVTGKFEDFMV